MKNKKEISKAAEYIIPSIIALMVNSVYIIVDGFFVLNGVGEKALAAVTLCVPFLEVLIAVSMLISVGAGIYISYYLGAEKKNKANEVLNISLLMLIIISLGITVFGLMYMEKLAYLLGSNEEMLELVCSYLKYLVMFAPTLTLSYAFATYLRNDGKPKLAMTAMSLGGVLNIVLNYIFIFKFHMGVEGSSLATGIGPLFSILIMLPHFIFKKGNLYFKIFQFNLNMCKKIFVSGIPAFLTEFSIGTITYLHNLVIIKILGEHGIAVYGIIGYISLIVLTLFLGTGHGIQPLAGIAYGAKKYKELKIYINIYFIFISVIGILSTLIVLIFAEPIIRIFSGENAVLTESTILPLKLYSLNFLTAGMNILVISILQSIRKSNLASVIAVIRSSVFIMVALYVLPKIAGEKGLWLAMPFAEIACLVLVGFILWRMKKFGVKSPLFLREG